MAKLNRVREHVTQYGATNMLEEDLLRVLGITGTTVEDIITMRNTPTPKIEVLRELLRRMQSVQAKQHERLCSPRAAGNYLLGKSAGMGEEQFGILCLNAKGDLIADAIVSMGTASGCLVSPREVFRRALYLGATSVIAWHNHPSGSSEPSREDIDLTRRLRQTGEALGVPLADHIIVGKTEYTSLRAVQGWDHV